LSIRDPRPEKPGELPVQTRAKYEVVNLKAANVIGLNIPPALPLCAGKMTE
jgi:hypothetical protein